MKTQQIVNNRKLIVLKSKRSWQMKSPIKSKQDKNSKGVDSKKIIVDGN